MSTADHAEVFGDNLKIQKRPPNDCNVKHGKEDPLFEFSKFHPKQCLSPLLLQTSFKFTHLQSKTYGHQLFLSSDELLNVQDTTVLVKCCHLLENRWTGPKLYKSLKHLACLLRTRESNKSHSEIFHLSDEQDLRSRIFLDFSSCQNLQQLANAIQQLPCKYV